MALEARDVLSIDSLRVPVGRWEELHSGQVLYEAPEHKVRLGTGDNIVSKTVVGENDTIGIEFFVNEIPADAAEMQYSNLGKFENTIVTAEDIQNHPSMVWRSNKPLRNYQVRVK